MGQKTRIIQEFLSLFLSRDRENKPPVTLTEIMVQIRAEVPISVVSFVP